jgi:hypothetical protein
MRRLALLVMFTAVACSDDPVNYSAPVGLKLNLQTSNVDTGVFSDEKNVNTESGNPYGAFVSGAREALGGDPGRIELTGATIAMSSGTTGAASLGEVFAGEVELSFELDAVLVPIAHLNVTTANTTLGPVDMVVDFDFGALTEAQVTALIGGGFKVVATGPATEAFSTGTVDGLLELSLTFAAFEE